MTGYKAVDTRLLKQLSIKSNDFKFEAELTAKVLKK